MDPYNYMSKMKTVLVFRPNENTGAADRRMAGPTCAAARHTRKASERNAVSTNGLPLKKPMPSDHARRERKKLTHTHKRTKPKKLHKKSEPCKMAAEQARHKKMYALPYNEAYIGRGDVLSASTMAASPSVSGALPVRLLNHMRCD